MIFIDWVLTLKLLCQFYFWSSIQSRNSFKSQFNKYFKTIWIFTRKICSTNNELKNRKSKKKHLIDASPLAERKMNRMNFLRTKNCVGSAKTLHLQHSKNSRKIYNQLLDSWIFQKIHRVMNSVKFWRIRNFTPVLTNDW